MSEHRARIAWRRTTESFAYPDYDRSHEWHFEGGHVVPAAAAPEFLGRPERVDPEAAFAAALSSCHMLTFLALCARKRLVVDAYEDEATALLAEGEDGRLWVTRVVLRPRIAFGGGRRPDARERARLHQLAHRECFIAGSVRTEVVVEERD